MPVQSKKKGNRVELEFAKLLSKRFNEPFARVPMSGAFGTINANTDIRQDAKDILTGDLICPKWFAYTVEVKSRAGFNFWDLLNRETKNEIDDWIDQAKYEAKIVKKQWIIIVKVNNRKPFVIMKAVSTFKYDITYGCYGILRWDYFLNYPDYVFRRKDK